MQCFAYLKCERLGHILIKNNRKYGHHCEQCRITDKQPSIKNRYRRPFKNGRKHRLLLHRNVTKTQKKKKKNNI